MPNLIGDLPESSEVLAVPYIHLHLYGESARPGRKLGHVILPGASPRRPRPLRLPPRLMSPLLSKISASLSAYWLADGAMIWMITGAVR